MKYSIILICDTSSHFKQRRREIMNLTIREVTFLLLIFLHFDLSKSSLILNEIAYSGSADQCDGKDWIELLNQGPSEINLSNYVLHDDKGKDDEDAMIFANITLAPNVFQVLCKGPDFEFGIGSSDTVTLLDDDGSILSSIALPGTSAGGGEVDLTYAFFTDGNSGSYQYEYTATPTPGEANVYTEPKPLEQVLHEQNEAGKDFFVNDMEPGTVGSSPIFEKVVDIYINLDVTDLAAMEEHPTHEEFVPFKEISVHNANNDTAIAFGGKGKIRTKGQSTLMIPACLGLKNVPFQIEFDAPFYGIEVAYLRNHLSDASYMRDYASHVMLKNFGLPYLRCRPVRLFLNGEYVGFYTMMEAPTQAYVMQRSFGAFDPAQSALFKMKTMVTDCPFTDPSELEVAKNQEIPDPYYFERGDHRADPPENGNYDECAGFFFGEIIKERADMIKGYLEHNQTCGLAMVELGRVDRDYGTKSIEEGMIDFLDSALYNKSVTDIKGFINADQWIKNFASYAVTLNQDSVIMNVNNWYLATTSSGAGDWSIVQYDHNNIATRDGAGLCSPTCGPRMIYWPILRPSCRAVEDHIILGRILNNENSVETYLAYVEEFVGVLESGLLEDLRSYGNEIKTFVVEDPLNLQSVEQYESTELSTDFDEYNVQSMPLLQVLNARIVQVKAQLAAIKAGTLPRNGDYGSSEECPDWRDTDGSDYNAGSTLADVCIIPGCAAAAPCYENSVFTCQDGELVIPACQAASPFCNSCFPFSKCGTYNDNSDIFVESDECGSDLSSCKDGAACFDHRGGICAFDGEILIEECRVAEQVCTSCFPNSRCASKSGIIDDATGDNVTATDDGTMTDDIAVVIDDATEADDDMSIPPNASSSSTIHSSMAILFNGVILSLWLQVTRETQ